jgi:tRNA(His) 5'-end guanylyltransferase
MKDDKDIFGTRMKLYEKAEAGRLFMPLLPICVRLDGKCFHNFTHRMKRPYDERLSKLMVMTTKYLVDATGARAGYTQSDEISLVYYSDSIHSQVFFNGRIQKIVSVSAAMCATYFNEMFDMCFNEPSPSVALFDSRAWQVPSLVEAANVFLWREQDATKNAISMAARHYFSDKELHGKSGSEMQELLFQKGVNFNNYPAFFKRGTFVLRRMVSRPFTAAEIEVLPEKHEARRNPGLLVERQEIFEAEMPKFSTVTNRVEVLFDGVAPVVA